MSASDLNLARQPFQNEAPVLRAALVLWILAALLVGANGWFWWRHFSGARLTRGQQQEVREQIDAESARIAAIEAELAGFDLPWQNRQASFVNRRIAERVFAWSQLFDDLEEVLPGEVRLSTLSPNFGDRRERAEPSDGPIRLELRGHARSGEALLAFVDRLFQHPAFERPNLLNEARQEATLTFTLAVLYLRPAPVASAAPPAPASGDAESAAAAAAGDDAAAAPGRRGRAPRGRKKAPAAEPAEGSP